MSKTTKWTSGRLATRKRGPNNVRHVVWTKCKSFYLFFSCFFLANYLITSSMHKEGGNKDNKGGNEDNWAPSKFFFFLLFFI